jgi:D-alanyl-D-alanine carboxypeptidase
VFNADFQRQWLDSPQPTDPAAPAAPHYGYGIERQGITPDVTLYYHFGEMPGFNAFSGYDPANEVTLVIWSNLTVGLDSRQTANTLLIKVIDQIYSLPSQVPPSAPPTTR